MADLRISELPELIGTDVEAGDDIAVADYSASETRRLTAKALIQNGVQLIDDGSIPGVKLVADSVTALEIAPNAVTASEIANNAVTTAAIQSAAVVNSKIAVDTITGGRLVADTLTSREIGPDAITDSELADDSVDTAAIQDDAVTDAKIADGIDGSKIADGTVTDAELAAGIDGGKLVVDSVTAREIAPNAVTPSELADDSVFSNAIQNLAVTDRTIASGIDGAKLTDGTIKDAKLAAGIDGAKLDNGTVNDSKLAAGIDGAKLTNLTVTNSKLANDIDGSKFVNSSVTNEKLAGSIEGSKLKNDTVTALQLALGSVGASELANNAVETDSILDGAVTDAKLASGIDGGKLASGSITSTQLGVNSVTAIGLANNAVDTDAIASEAVTDAEIKSGINGAKLQDASVTDSKLASDIDGAKLKSGSANGSAINAASFVRGIDNTGGFIGITNAIASGIHSGIEFDEQGLIIGTSPITESELPLATETTVGASSYPVGSGLIISSVGEVTHETSIVAGTFNGVSYDETGHITGINLSDPINVQIATASTLGVVSVPGPGLAVDSTGSLTHSASPLSAGDYIKVTTDSFGHVIGSQALEQNDIPTLDAGTKLSGTINNDLIGDSSITREQLANYSIAYIQEATPDVNDNPYIGCLWYRESTAGLHMWNGNSFMPISIGRLSQENLRYCGTVDASTGLITGVTTFGTAAGYVGGGTMNIQGATDLRTGVYFVIDTPGSGLGGTSTPELNGITFDAGDWVLCNGSSVGWARIDTLSSSGGGGATVLNDLLDVDTAGVSTGDFLAYDASAKWMPVDEIYGGTY